MRSFTGEITKASLSHNGLMHAYYFIYSLEFMSLTKTRRRPRRRPLASCCGRTAPGRAGVRIFSVHPHIYAILRKTSVFHVRSWKM